MNKLYACIAEDSETNGGAAHISSLRAIAERFAYRIEAIDGGILFDVGGLHNRIGSPAQIARSIWREMDSRNIKGSLAIARNASTAMLYARSRNGVTVIDGDGEQALPLEAAGIGQDMLNVFHALGFENTADLKRVPVNDLIARYGPEFRKTIDLINQNGVHILTPNLKDNTVAWDHKLDFPVDDFERLIFILGHGLSKVLDGAREYGFSSEQIDIALELEDKTVAEYRIKLSFPTTDQKFWLKLINLRIGGDPPGCEIVSIRLVCHFARPRAIERGLFSATRPEPESLLLTVDKIKNAVGAENVGVPVLIDQRLPEAFKLDPKKLPLGREQKEHGDIRPVVALNYFHPPLAAETSISGGRLVYLKTQYFAGRVTEYGGAWRESSVWWAKGFWQRTEWDVELENKKIYRLAWAGKEWWVTGGYD